MGKLDDVKAAIEIANESTRLERLRCATLFAWWRNTGRDHGVTEGDLAAALENGTTTEELSSTVDWTAA